MNSLVLWGGVPPPQRTSAPTNEHPRSYTLLSYTNFLTLPMNMQLTAIVAENKLLDREKLAHYAHDLGFKVVSKVASGEWLIDECEKYEPDIINCCTISQVQVF